MKCTNCGHDLNWKGDLHLKLFTSKNKGYSSNNCMELGCGCTKPEPETQKVRGIQPTTHKGGFNGGV